ncbi:hypothetical protein JST97_08555 [bacterium]|nr:hypothetical protein [bacterium]
MKEHHNFKQIVQEKPLTSLGGAVVAGFALGSGLAVPLLAGAGLSRAGLGRMVQSWLMQELEDGVRQWMRPTAASTPADREADELAGYRGTRSQGI